MPKGLAFPLGVNPNGGMAVVEGDENDKKIMTLGLSNNESDNHFQNLINVGLDAIFNINDPSSQSDVQALVAQLFERFEAQRRFRLLTPTIKWRHEDGEMIMEFKYLCLESDESKSFARPMLSASEGAR